MPSEFEGRPRRRYDRATGPFDGLIDSPVLIYDLNPGGCFINSPLEQPEGSILVVKIDLLQEGWVTVNGEAIYRHKSGFAVRFVGIDEHTVARLARTVEAWKARRATQW